MTTIPMPLLDRALEAMSREDLILAARLAQHTLGEHLQSCNTETNRLIDSPAFAINVSGDFFLVKSSVEIINSLRKAADRIERLSAADPSAFAGTSANLRELQVTQPWSIRYSRDFRANPQSHKNFAHASVHVSKANGKIAAFIDDLDHRRDSTEQARIADYLADLVICALRMANTFPGEKIDLQAAVERRIAAKNQEPPATDAEREGDAR